MPPNPWVWEPRTHRYRNTASGRFVGARQMVQLRDTFIEAQKARTADLAARWASGELTTAQWREGMRLVIKQTYIDQYVMAKGGRGQLTQADYGRIGALVKEQYKFLQGFERDLKNGQMTSAGQVAYRAALYVDSATSSFERGRAEALGAPKLPQYPGDGATVCRTSCKCHWEIERVTGGWLAYWRLGPVKTEHCPDCYRNAGVWNPLVVEAT